MNVKLKHGPTKQLQHEVWPKQGHERDDLAELTKPLLSIVTANAQAANCCLSWLIHKLKHTRATSAFDTKTNCIHNSLRSQTARCLLKAALSNRKTECWCDVSVDMQHRRIGNVKIIFVNKLPNANSKNKNSQRWFAVDEAVQIQLSSWL